MTLPSALLSALLAAVAVPRPAAATACSAPVIQADAGFRSRFPELDARLARELGGSSELDGCATVQLRLEPSGAATIVVTLPDGRSATRSGIRDDDLQPTLQALLLLPEHPRAVEAAATPAPTPIHVEPRRPTRWTAHLEHDTLPSTPAPRSLGFELSVVGGARVGDGQLGYGAGVLSFLQVQKWLFGFQGRADGYRTVRGSDPQTALALGLLAGRRWDLGSVALDVTAGPALAIQGFTLSRTESVHVDGPASSAPPPPPPAPSEQDPGAVPRLLFGARLSFAPRAVFRSFVGLDGELGPTPGGTADTTVGHLPRFSVGLSLGATVGSP